MIDSLKRVPIEIIFFLAICFLIFNTGLHGDDLLLAHKFQDASIFSSDLLNQKFIQFLPWFYFKGFFFNIFHYDFLLYDFVKIAVNFSSCFILAALFQKALSKTYSWVIAFAIIFNPIHDTTVYWFTGQYFNFAFLLPALSFLLYEKNRYIIATLTNFIAAFFSYASPPFGLAFTFYLFFKKKYKLSLIYSIPHVIYFIFYFYLKISQTGGQSRIGSLSIFGLIKQYALQVGTSIDSYLGPSSWLKYFYSILEINFLTLVICALVLISLFFKNNEQKISSYVHNRKELLDIAVLFTFVMILSMGMFALTGGYMQTAFNFANRASFYSAFFYLTFFALLIQNKSVLKICSILAFLAIFGLSDHWKTWNKKQLGYQNLILSNTLTKDMPNTSIAFVKGGLYSKLGPFGHIEYTAEGHALQLFWLQSKKHAGKLYPLAKRMKIDEKEIFDTKYDLHITAEDFFYIDLDQAISKSTNLTELREIKSNMNFPIRHWLQLFDRDSALLKVVKKVIPRVEYLF